MGTMKTIDEIKQELMTDPRNQDYTQRDIPPIFQADPQAKILIIGQAPGKKVEESLIPFHDKSGEKLMAWMGIDANTFYSKDIAIVPMDFYYPDVYSYYSIKKAWNIMREKSYGDGQKLCVIFAALFSHRASEPIKFSLAEKESLV